MTSVLLAGLGGFVGSSLRYGVALLLPAASRGGFGVATVAVNVVGCLSIGVITQAMASRGALSPHLTVFLMVGLLGGFTTFSTFGHETVEMWQQRGPSVAALVAAAHVVLGVGAVWVGRLATQQVLN